MKVTRKKMMTTTKGTSSSQKVQGNRFFPGVLASPVDPLRGSMMIFAIFLLATSTMVVQAGPARMLSSGTNKIVSTSSQSTTSALNSNSNNNGASSNSAGNHNGHPAALISNMPEEEMELESLKGSASGSNIPSKKSGSDATPTSRPLAYVKKPENEETPALSDNANSLKYGGANADFEEALANMAHIPPPSKAPSLSVKNSAGLGGLMSDAVAQKRTRNAAASFGGGSNGAGGMGLLSRVGAANGVNVEVDYTPQDIAEYIFWMGDERGVELALSDFVQEGLISAQDAVRFLEDVKAELSLLRNRYATTISQGSRTSSATAGGMDFSNSHGDPAGFWEVPLRTVSKKQGSSYYISGGSPASSSSYFSGNNVYNSPSASSMELMNSPSYYSAGPASSSSSYRSPLSSSSAYNGNLYKDATSKSSATSANSLEDMLDYEEIVDKLRQADTKMREVALEGIIYQVARELFSMGLQQSSSSSVPTFTKFIETVSANGNLSKDLERSVLETLVQALVDAANEHGLLNANSKPSSSSSSSPAASAAASSSIERQLSALSASAKARAEGVGSGTQKPISIKKKSV